MKEEIRIQDKFPSRIECTTAKAIQKLHKTLIQNQYQKERITIDYSASRLDND